MMCQAPPLLPIARALADQTRLDILHRLSEGPASVSELVDTIGVSQSKVSNHLQMLRESQLVRATPTGRKQIYTLANSNVGVLLEALGALSRPRSVSKTLPALSQARTCYDHLAGKVGVDVYKKLLKRKVLVPDDQSTESIALGPAGIEFFQSINIDLSKVGRAKRRFVTSCLDWTEKEFHLGGGLGAALCDRFIQLGYVVKQPGTRAVVVTRKGWRAMVQI